MRLSFGSVRVGDFNSDMLSVGAALVRGSHGSFDQSCELVEIRIRMCRPRREAPIFGRAGATSDTYPYLHHDRLFSFINANA